MNVQDLLPVQPQEPARTGWMPTGSTLTSLTVGAAVAQTIVGSLVYFTHQPVGDVLSNAIGILCVAAINYLHPDGGRK